MATHSSILAWRIPWIEEPVRLQSMGSQTVWHNWATSLSRIGEGNGNPLQCPCLENPMDRGAWRATVHGVTKSWTQLSNWACTHIRIITYDLSMLLKTCEQFKITDKSRTRRKLKREETYVYLWLTHADVCQKAMQYCKAIILQLKINKFKFKKSLKSRTK